MKAERLCAACKRVRPAEAYRSRTARKCDECLAAVPTEKPCARCGEVRPISEYVRSGRNCAACRAVPPPSACAIRPRKCFRCHEEKPAEEFPWGDGARGKGVYRRRRSICAGCIAAEEREKREKARKRSTWTEGDKLVRRCSSCDEVKDLFEGFYVNKPHKQGFDRYGYHCKDCTKARVAEAQRRRLRDPEKGAAEREKRREWQRDWRRRNPDKYRLYRRRYRVRLLADPQRHAHRLESQRMAYRLRQLDSGRTNVRVLTRSRVGRVLHSVATERGGTLPALPLARRIEQLIHTGGPRTTLDGVPTALDVCARLGISDRDLRGWSTGERATVQLDTVDRVLTRAGWHWWDVYGDESLEVQTKAARLLAGEEIAS